MEYHFHVSPRFVWKGTPAFLYFVTVAYFCTYYTAMVMLWRVFRRRFPRAGVAGVLVRALLSYAVAFAETAFMANETLKSYFSYGDPRWVMIWGSLCYGTIFFVTLPSFARLDEERPTGETTFDLVRHCLACNMLILMCYELYGFLIRR
jgi:cycloeucalenol cycloisomerase